jgi:hypothetical protein
LTVSGKLPPVSVPWTPNLATFFRPTDKGGQASIIVDLGALEVEPVASHPTLVLLVFALQNPRHDGLLVAEEREACTKLENALIGLMSEAIDGWSLGHIIVGGDVILPFYGLREPLRPWEPLQDARPYAVRSKTEDDPDWSYLHDVMAPVAAELRQIASLRQLHALRGHGDDPHAQREVDWTITVPDDPAAAAVAHSLRAGGYRVTRPAALVITATAVQSLELGPLLHRQEELAALAERHGGELDGWGAPITTSSIPPARRRRWGLPSRS